MIPRKYLILITAVVIVVAITGLVFSGEPLYSAEDFENEARVFYNRNLPREELDLRLEDQKNTKASRQEESPAEAALDAFNDYKNAGLYGEAWRVSQIIDSNHKGIVDAEYLEKRGDLLVSMHQYKDAVESFAEALGKDSKRASVYGKLADLYLYWSDADNRKQKALALYKKALANNPDPDKHAPLQRQIEALKNSL